MGAARIFLVGDVQHLLQNGQVGNLHIKLLLLYYPFNITFSNCPTVFMIEK
jgi:hypothetical protein